jgi:pyruvate carboxylase subunit B
MVLGYFGRTPVTPNAEVVALASQQLKLEPTTKNALELADADETKSLSHVRKMLEEANLAVTDENLLIAAACKEKGIAFLKGEAKVNVRKIEKEKPATPAASTGSSEFTVTVNGQKYHVRSEGNDTTFVIDGEVYIIDVKDGAEEGVASCSAAASNTNGGREIKAGLPGSIFKVLVNEGDKVKKGQPVIVIEAMKMEIEVTSPEDGVVSSVKVKQGDTIVNNQVLVTL